MLLQLFILNENAIDCTVANPTGFAIASNKGSTLLRDDITRLYALGGDSLNE